MLYTFTKQYKTTVGNKNINTDMVGSIPYQELIFNSGDTIEGNPVKLNPSIIRVQRGNLFLEIPNEYLFINPLGSQNNAKLPLSVTNPELFKKNLEESRAKDKQMMAIGRLTTLAKLSVPPIALYAFSKFKGYDNTKTAKVTIIGSVIIIGAIALNGFSGAWSGTSIMDRTFGQQKFW